MKTGVFNKFPQGQFKKKLLKKKVFLPTDLKKFGDITRDRTFFFLCLTKYLFAGMPGNEIKGGPMASNLSRYDEKFCCKRKCWLPAFFFLIPTMCEKGFFLVVMQCDQGQRGYQDHLLVYHL